MPFEATITSIQLTGFASDQSGGAPPIEQYGGDPLYCHVTPIGTTGQFSIAIDQNAPSSFAPGSGPVQFVTLTYARNGVPTQTMTFIPTGATPTYDGQPLDMALHLEDLAKARLAITQTPAAGAVAPAGAGPAGAAAAPPAALMPSTDPPVIGLVVLSPNVTKTHSIGFFTNVPVDTPDFRQHTLATISWPQPGSSLGPMGVVTVV